MRTIIQYTFFGMLGFLLTYNTSSAQNNKQAKIMIEKIENGESITIDTTLNVDDLDQLEEILKGLNIGSEIELDIDSEGEDIDVEVEIENKKGKYRKEVSVIMLDKSDQKDLQKTLEELNIELKELDIDLNDLNMDIEKIFEEADSQDGNKVIKKRIIVKDENGNVIEQEIDGDDEGFIWMSADDSGKKVKKKVIIYDENGEIIEKEIDGDDVIWISEEEAGEGQKMKVIIKEDGGKKVKKQIKVISKDGNTIIEEKIEDKDDK